MVIVKNHNATYFKIENNPEVKSQLDNYFTVYDKEFDPDQNCKIAVPVNVLKFDDEWIYIPISIAENVVDYLGKSDIVISEVEYDDKVKLKTPQIYLDLFNNREGQLEDYNHIISKNRGAVQLFTGAGKSLMMVAIADSYIEDDKNILIIAPMSSICDELRSRLIKYNVHNLNKIEIINPVGHVNSSRYSDPEWIKWMNNVGLILIDEAENISDSLKTLFEEQLISYKYCYGFSANCDKFNNDILKINGNLSGFTQSSYSIINYIGTSLVYKKSTLKVNLNIIHSTFGNKRCPPFLKGNINIEFNLAIKNIIEHENFVKCIQLMVDKKKDILFIPVSAIKHGIKIAEIISNYRPELKVIQWSSSSLTGVDYIDSYEALKNNAEKIDVIIATKIAFLGIDIPRISDVLLIVGTQANTIQQPIGRAFRNPNPSVWLIDENNDWKNHIYKMCHYRRISFIRRNYVIKDTYEYSI